MMTLRGLKSVIEQARKMSSKKFVPLFDRVVIRRAKSLDRVGNILLPDTAQKKANIGHVVAVGPGMRTREGKLIPTTLREGDKVLLSEYGGRDIEIDGEELTVFREDEIVAKLEDK